MSPPVFLIGLDAADAGLVRTWASEGRLPALARLLREERSAVVENPAGLYTGAVWPSFTTASPMDEWARGGS